MQKLLLSLLLLLSLKSMAQPGADPAITDLYLIPTPLQGVGALFKIGTTIGNNGTVSISGLRGGIENRMQFSLCLAKCAPNPASTAALSGELLNYFDVSYDAASNCFEGIQKQNIELAPYSVYSLTIASVVTSTSAERYVNDVGAACRVFPNSDSYYYQPSGNDFTYIYTTTIDIAMPVSLISFQAEAMADRSVLLSWQTAWERANKEFFLERSKDLLAFEVVGQLTDVAGSSTNRKTYQFVDPSPYRGTSYYRLRQVDQDGSSLTFKAEAVVIDARYGLYPNPIVGQQFTLELDEPTRAVIRLYTASGSELGLNKLTSTQTSITLRPVTHLTPGAYMIAVEERGITRQHRLVVP